MNRSAPLDRPVYVGASPQGLQNHRSLYAWEFGYHFGVGHEKHPIVEFDSGLAQQRLSQATVMSP